LPGGAGVITACGCSVTINGLGTYYDLDLQRSDLSYAQLIVLTGAQGSQGGGAFSWELMVNEFANTPVNWGKYQLVPVRSDGNQGAINSLPMWFAVFQIPNAP
jgi:hypothetical protein